MHTLPIPTRLPLFPGTAGEGGGCEGKLEGFLR